MPQKKFTDQQRVESVKSVVEGTLRKIHEAGVENSLPENFHYRIKDWTQDDITAFAKGSKTFDFFENLLSVANTAVAKVEDGDFTAAEIKKAQEALTSIKPDAFKTWKGFGKAIANAADASQEIRDGYRKEIEKKNPKKHSSIISSKAFSDIALNDNGPTLDQAQRTIAEKTTGGEPAKLIFDEQNLNLGIAKLQSKALGRDAA